MKPFVCFVAPILLFLSVIVIAPTRQAAYKRDTESFLSKAATPFLLMIRRSHDEELYHGIASGILHGELLRSDEFRTLPPSKVVPGTFNAPYRAVPLEYPPLNLPLLVLPALFARSFQHYCIIFESLMLLLLYAGVYVTSGLRGRGVWIAAALVLCLGVLVVQRLDAAPALAFALLAQATQRRHALLFGVAGGLLFCLKLVPFLVFLAVLLGNATWLLRKRLLACAGLLLVLVPGFGIPTVMYPEWIGQVLSYHASRPLHVESTYAAFLFLAKLSVGAPLSPASTYGSANLEGALSETLARVSPALTLLASAGLFLFLKRRASPSLFAPHQAARVITLFTWTVLLTGKVFSPQYLTWLIPLYAVLSKREALLFGIVLALSQGYYRIFDYAHVEKLTLFGGFQLWLRLAFIAVLLFTSAKALQNSKTVAT